MNTRAQKDRILDHLATGRPLTPIAALKRFGCFRLGARIWDLKREGHRIQSEMVTRNGTRVAQYRLAN